MAFNNFTVNIVSFNEVVGTDWAIDNPSVVLTITPDSGYEVYAANFSPILPLPPYVNSVVFTQNGANIDCSINYSSPSIMPALDVLVDLCINGFASLIGLSVSGTVDYNTVNTSQPVPSITTESYNGVGSFNTTSQVENIAVVATDGYYFPVLPTASLDIGTLADYSIVTTLTNDSAGNLIQVNFAVNYTFPNYSVTGDNIIIEANASEIYNPPIEIQSYSINSNDVLISGETRSITISGITGAAWQLQVTESVTGATIGSFTGTIDSSGFATESIIFPASLVDVVYTFTLTGNLASSFCLTSPCATGQLSVWQLYQYTAQTVSFALTSSKVGVVVGAADTKAFTPYVIPGVRSYSVSASNATLGFAFSTTPSNTDWSNQGLGDPITNQTVQDPLIITIDNVSNPKTLTIDLDTDIGIVGAQPLLSELNLNNFLIYLQPIQLYYGETEQEACCSGVLGSYFILENETFSDAIAILLADGTPAADGFYTE